MYPRFLLGGQEMASRPHRTRRSASQTEHTKPKTKSKSKSDGKKRSLSQPAAHQLPRGPLAAPPRRYGCDLFVKKKGTALLTCRPEGPEPVGFCHCRGLFEDIRTWRRPQVTFWNIAASQVNPFFFVKLRLILWKFRYLPRTIRWMRTETQKL